jgi:pectinesterase inhibitor-like protein
MKSTKLSPSSFFIIFLCLIFNGPIPTLSLKLYEIVCNQAAQDRNDCLNFLKDDSRITSATTYHDLSRYILNFAISEATSVQAYIRALARYNPNDEALKQCENDFYNKVLGAFNRALSELNNDPQSAKNDVQSASDGVASCEKAIQNKKGKYDPAVHVRNNEVFVLSEVAFIAINHLT